MYPKLRILWPAIAALAAVATSPARPETPAPPPVDIRVYTLDGGALEFKDMRSFSDTGDYDGKPGKLAVPCFIIRHPRGILLWDTGLDPALAKRQSAESQEVRISAGPPIEQQLQQIGLTPRQITYVAFSHLHVDHIGNANLFAASTWILNKTELAWATAADSPMSGSLGSFSAYKSAKQQLIDGDHDVFGDGTVRILKTPGHTPGHQVLLVHLQSGKILLSGDLYHLRSDVTQRLVYEGNTDRAATLASFDRVERILRNSHARLIVQHDPQDYASLPKLPQYLH